MLNDDVTCLKRRKLGQNMGLGNGVIEIETTITHHNIILQFIMCDNN